MIQFFDWELLLRHSWNEPFDAEWAAECFLVILVASLLHLVAN